MFLLARGPIGPQYGPIILDFGPFDRYSKKC